VRMCACSLRQGVITLMVYLLEAFINQLKNNFVFKVAD
jgi:hypothetical protein